MKKSNPYIKFIIGSNSYETPYSLGFEVEFSMEGTNTAKAYIYNPADELITEIINLENKKVIIDAGFEDDHGVCFSGEIYKVEIKESKLERMLELKICDSFEKWTTKMISTSWPANVTASTVVNELAEQMQIDQGQIEIKVEKKYPRGLTFNTSLKNALQEMARETKSDFFIRDGRLYFLEKDFPGIKTYLQVDASTGLTNGPEILHDNLISEERPEKRKLGMLFNYKLGAGDNFKVKAQKSQYSKSGNLETVNEEITAKVLRGKHFFTEADAYTEMEVQVI